MSYLVLARKWRPKNFQEMVGQEHVVKVLSHALDNDRMHHAFLFTGTRGVGKTTISRIIAKALNCEKGVSSTPCGACSQCRDIDEGRFFDLIEVDAASRTGVDDTRDLLENVQYKPTQGRYKVYLIDEVHMLSISSFNALLKTLEEPPAHVKFLLATTDPQKIPATILSRCLQFHLKCLPIEQIGAHLTYLLQQEAIQHDADAIKLIARAAEGSMRDGLSLLDQAISMGNGAVTETDVREMLGVIEHRYIQDIVQHLIDKNGAALIGEAHKLYERAANLNEIVADLIELFHQIALAQVVPDAITEAVSNKEKVMEYSKALTAQSVQLYYQMALAGSRDIAFAPNQRVAFEMLLLRMLAFSPVLPPASDKFLSAQGGGAQSTGATDASVGKEALAQNQQMQAAPNTPNTVTQAAPAAVVSETATYTELSNWDLAVTKLELSGLALQLALNCRVTHFDDKRLQLQLDSTNSHLNSDGQVTRLTNAIEQRYGALQVVVELADNVQNTPAQAIELAKSERLQEAETKLLNDPALAAVMSRFDAKIQEGSIIPH